MVELHLCGYCRALPENDRGQAAQVLHCPLCKAELGCGADGEHFRLRAGDRPAPVTWRSPVLWAGLAAGIAVSLLLWFLLHLSPARPPAASPAPPATALAPVPATQMVSTAETSAATPEPSGRAPCARAKGFLHPPVAYAKTSPYQGQPPTAVRVEALRAWIKPARSSQVGAAKVAPESRLDVLRDAVRQAEGPGTAPLGGLEKVPELSLISDEKTEAARESREQLAALVQTTFAENGNNEDRFVRELAAKRSDLAGLPFLLGSKCRLDARTALLFTRASASMRSALALAQFKGAEEFWGRLAEQGLTGATYLPLLMQILAPEDPVYRCRLVEQIGPINEPSVTEALARLAVFDPDRQVRLQAVEALRSRRSDDYADTLLQSFHYPWPAVAYRAAEAVALLDCRVLAPRLVDFLEENDPAAPVVGHDQDKKELRVRELVRVNHHRNCLLCHAVAGERTPPGEMLGVVPSPDRPLPSLNSTAYYAVRRGETAVRASVTDLRQDFSLIQSVPHARRWPVQQRFDFLIRTRTVSADEGEALKQKQAARRLGYPSENHRAAILALWALTGVDVGNDPATLAPALAKRK